AFSPSARTHVRLALALLLIRITAGFLAFGFCEIALVLAFAFVFRGAGFLKRDSNGERPAINWRAPKLNSINWLGSLFPIDAVSLKNCNPSAAQPTHVGNPGPVASDVWHSPPLPHPPVLSSSSSFSASGVVFVVLKKSSIVSPVHQSMY